MSISISNDGSYFSIGYIDNNYIAPDILVLGATSIAPVSVSTSLQLSLDPISSNVNYTIPIIALSISSVSTNLSIDSTVSNITVSISSTSSIGYVNSVELLSSAILSDNLVSGEIGSVVYTEEFSNNVTESISGVSSSTTIGNFDVEVIQITNVFMSGIDSSTTIGQLSTNTIIDAIGIVGSTSIGNEPSNTNSNLTSNSSSILLNSPISLVDIGVTGTDVIASTGTTSVNLFSGLSTVPSYANVGTLNCHSSVIADGVSCVSVTGTLYPSTVNSISGNTVSSSVSRNDVTIALQSYGLELNTNTGIVSNLSNTAIFGIVSTSSITSLASNITNSVSKNDAFAITGSIVSEHLATVIGNTASTSVGTEPNKTELNVTGTQSHSAVGLLEYNIDTNLSGNSVSGSVSSVTTAKTLAITGNTNQSSVGSVSQGISKSSNGVSSSFDINTVQYSITTSIQGNAATVSIANEPTSITGSLYGNGLSTSIGSIASKFSQTSIIGNGIPTSVGSISVGSSYGRNSGLLFLGFHAKKF